MVSLKKRSQGMDLSTLKAYHGYQSAVIPLSTGYYVYLASWDSTPTEFSSFSNIWVVTPDDRRILFADPPASSDAVCIYHDFDEIHGSSISLDWASEERLRVHCSSLNGEHEVELEFRLKVTLGSRLLVAVAGGLPTPFQISKPMIAATDFFVDLFVAKGGSRMVGRTETGQPFYNGAAERVMRIEGGTATMDGEDLGVVSRPTWPVTFGDGVPFVQPVFKLGTLYVPFEEEMLESRA
jgi:hypothetical protein